MKRRGFAALLWNHGDGAAMIIELWPGAAFPLGATPSPGGTGFAVASEVADAVVLCLFDSHGRETRLPLPEYDAGVWHGFVPGVGPGQRYGYRVHGPYDPSRGLRCNPAKLLLDPYAKAIVGGVAWDDSFAGDNRRDSAPFAPRSIVVDPAFDWGDDRPPGTRLADSVIYETPCQGDHRGAPGPPAGASRHLRGACPPGGARAPGRPGGDRGRAAAGPAVGDQRHAGRAGVDQLLGL